jgi:hypothetical protein
MTNDILYTVCFDYQVFVVHCEIFEINGKKINFWVWKIKACISGNENQVCKHMEIVPDPGKGVCANPVNRGAILEGGGRGPPGGNKERQLSPDKGRGKT